MIIQKRIKLTTFTKKLLLRKGQKDAQNKSIQAIGNNTPSSPYFDEETALCMANIHKEYEKFLKYKTKTQKKISKLDQKNSLCKSYMKMLVEEAEDNKNLLKQLDSVASYDITEEKLDARRLIGESIIYNNNELISPDMLKEFRKLEKKAAIEAQKNIMSTQKEYIKKRLSEHPKEVFELEKKITRIEMLNKYELTKLYTRFERFISRSNQHYELTLARLSVYWNGAKYIFQENQNFDISILLSKVKSNIYDYEKIGESIKC